MSAWPAGAGPIWTTLSAYRQLNRLARGFQVQNQTPVILADPEFFFGDDPGLKRPAGWLRWLPRWSFALLMPWLPVYILTLRKDENSVETLDGERF